MSTSEIQERIAHIEDVAGDYEAAHGDEDDLYADFVTYVATDPHDDDLGEKAKLVLTTRAIDFCRYCA